MEQTNKIFEAYASGFVLPEKISVAEWCEKHIAEIPYSPIPGPFRATNSPQVKPILEAIVSPSVRTVSIVAAVQTGKTLAAELALAYIIANLPGPCLWLAAKDDDGKNENESRLQPLFDNCPPVSSLYPLDKNKKRKAAIFFANGMPLWTVGANNRRNLQSRSIRWLFGDETWLWPDGRLAEAQARVAAFGRLGKCVFFSQGSNAGDDSDRLFQASDQREWCFVCPQCGEIQPFSFDALCWEDAEKDANGHWLLESVRESTVLRCRACGNTFENSARSRATLNANARFVAQNPNASRGNIGFRWNAIAFRDWGEIAVKFITAKAQAKAGIPDDLRAFYQQQLALAWKENDDFSADEIFDSSGAGYLLGDTDWDAEGIANNSERRFVPATEWTSPPPKDAARLRFLTVDVQDGYFVFVVRQWSPDGRSRLVQNGILQTFGDIDDTRERFAVPEQFTFIDAGFATQRVFDYCAKTRATALQGDRANRPFFRHSDGKDRYYSPKRMIRAGAGIAHAYYFSNLSCKDKLAELRRAGAEQWALPEDISPEYLKQLGAEYRSSVNGKPIWLRRGKRDNHYWDCEVMQIAAAYLMKLL